MTSPELDELMSETHGEKPDKQVFRFEAPRGPPAWRDVGKPAAPSATVGVGDADDDEHPNTRIF